MGEVPAWVPLVVALLGFVGVIAAQVLAGRRDDRRWRRECEHEREVRTREERAHSYAEVLGVIEAYDWALHRGRKMLEQSRPLDEHLADELREATRSAGRALGAINLHARRSISTCVRSCALTSAWTRRGQQFLSRGVDPLGFAGGQ